MAIVSDLERRGSHTPRRTREQRAYTLTVVGGVAGLVGVVGLVLAIFGVVGAGLPLLALLDRRGVRLPLQAHVSA